MSLLLVLLINLSIAWSWDAFHNFCGHCVNGRNFEAIVSNRFYAAGFALSGLGTITGEGGRPGIRKVSVSLPTIADLDP